MGEGQRERTLLEELRYLVGLNGSLLFGFNALIPLYPLGRAVILGGSAGGGTQYSRAQVEAAVAVIGLGVVVLFLPVYVRLVMQALRALEGGEAP